MTIMGDSESYWSAIHFRGADRKKTSKIITTLGEEGVYLVRDGTEGDKVLVVFIEQKARKFRIKSVPGGYCVHGHESVVFGTIEELMHYYYSNCLPSYNVFLTLPYQLHPRFSDDMLQ